jgi:hypothetical protein
VKRPSDRPVGRLLNGALLGPEQVSYRPTGGQSTPSKVTGARLRPQATPTPGPGVLAMLRAAQLSACAALVAASLACAQQKAPLRFATVSELPEEPRRAPGVAVDPAPRLPPPARDGAAEQSLVVLQTPADIGQAAQAVKRFFRVVLEEAPTELDSLLTPAAWVRSASSGSVERARSHWRARIARLDYGVLQGQLVYRESEFETYRAADLQQLSHRRRPALAATGDEVVIRVPISATRAGRVRLFGDEIWFRLRPHPDGYQIVEMAEDFRLP